MIVSSRVKKKKVFQTHKPSSPNVALGNCQDHIVDFDYREVWYSLSHVMVSLTSCELFSMSNVLGGVNGWEETVLGLKEQSINGATTRGFNF
jgi:hypothetical protein